MNAIMPLLLHLQDQHPTTPPPPLVELQDELPDLVSHCLGRWVLPQSVLDRYPLAEVEELRNLIRFAVPVDEQGDFFSESTESIARGLLLQRMRSPICENPTCLRPKGPGVAFYICQCCSIVIYCSGECQEADHPLHRVWSQGLPHSPQLIYCPQRPKLIQRDENGQPMVVYIHNSDGQIIDQMTGRILSNGQVNDA